MQPEALLTRFLELADGSETYFVSGSFSFLPLTGEYRQPRHDLDVAVGISLLERIRTCLRADERAHPLRLREIALAESSWVARVWSPRTSFVHVHTPSGLLDLAGYFACEEGLEFRLGLGISLRLPGHVLERVRTIKWRGHSYRAGPVELAFLPKAVAFARDPDALAAHHLDDLRRLSRIVDWRFIDELIDGGGLRVRGRRLPASLARRLHPFAPCWIARARHELDAR